MTSDTQLELLRQALDWARGGDVAKLQALLDVGCPVNLTNDRGDTLLILAAYHCQRGVVELLLARGADVERVNDNGQTALGSAVFRQDQPTVRLLLEHGAGPGTGAKSAVDVAAFFKLDAMSALLADPAR